MSLERKCDVRLQKVTRSRRGHMQATRRSRLPSLTLTHAGRGRGGDGQRDPDAAASTVLPAAAAAAAAAGVEEERWEKERGGVGVRRRFETSCH